MSTKTVERTIYFTQISVIANNVSIYDDEYCSVLIHDIKENDTLMSCDPEL